MSYASHVRRFNASECVQYSLDHGHTRFVHADDFDDAVDGYERWHKAYLDAKYPDMLPTRADLEKALNFAAAWLPALDGLDIPSDEVCKILIAAKDRSQANPDSKP